MGWPEVIQRLAGLLLVTGLGLFLFWPQQHLLRYRKPWQGSLAWVGEWRGWRGLALLGSRRGWEWRCGSLYVRGHWPAWVGCRLSFADWPRFWPLLRRLAEGIQIQSWRGGLEIGFADPALTGQCLGLLATLPPSLACHLRLTFAHTGWHGQGSLLLCFRAWRVLGPALELAWLILRSSRSRIR